MFGRCVTIDCSFEHALGYAREEDGRIRTRGQGTDSVSAAVARRLIE
jgi:hypothetical protein